MNPTHHRIVRGEDGNLTLEGMQLGTLKSDRELDEWIAEKTAGKEKNAVSTIADSAALKAQLPGNIDKCTVIQSGGTISMNQTHHRHHRIVRGEDGNLTLESMQLGTLYSDRELDEWIAEKVAGGRKNAAAREDDDAQDSADDEDNNKSHLSPYEQLRAARIKRNEKHLKELGLGQLKPRQTRKRRKVRRCSSSH